jgi:hypothetical protein
VLCFSKGKGPHPTLVSERFEIVMRRTAVSAAARRWI